MKNLFSDIPDDLPDELLETLLDADSVRIERIVSHGHASFEGFSQATIPTSFLGSTCPWLAERLRGRQATFHLRSHPSVGGQKVLFGMARCGLQAAFALQLLPSLLG